MLVGANEGLMLRTNLVETKANMALAKLAGFRAVNLHAFWWPDVTEPREYDQQTLGNVAGASRLLGIPVFVAVTNTRGRYTPQDDDQREQFAKFAANVAEDFPSFTRIIVGNEPNLSNFWQPQFDENGGDLAAVNYEKTLATTYDALKAVSPKITVIGGAVSPARARRSARGQQVALADDLHPRPRRGLQAERPCRADHGLVRLPPVRRELERASHDAPRDLDQHHDRRLHKLVKVLGQAFDGTNQIGSKIPIIYDEYGIESTIPKSKAKKYTGAEPASTKPVSPAVQGERYKQALSLAFCQPTVEGMFLYHAFDEVGRGQWQSGLYYVDHTAKPSLSIVRQAFQEVARGVIARCPGMRLGVNAKVAFQAPRQASAAGKRGSAIQFRLSCNLDCQYTSGVIDLSNGKSVLAASARRPAGRRRTVKMPRAGAAEGPLPRGGLLGRRGQSRGGQPQGEPALHGSVTLTGVHRRCLNIWLTRCCLHGCVVGRVRQMRTIAISAVLAAVVFSCAWGGFCLGQVVRRP